MASALEVAEEILETAGDFLSLSPLYEAQENKAFARFQSLAKFVQSALLPAQADTAPAEPGPSPTVSTPSPKKLPKVPATSGLAEALDQLRQSANFSRKYHSEKSTVIIRPKKV